ncbi:MAG: glycosyltransferase family 39 protein [Candidatus Omnitrophota bacterium]
MTIKDHKYLLILIAVASFLFFFRVGDMALTDPDETFYAQTAKEMLAADEWTTPLIFGEPQFEKPIFYYWLILISYKLFGVSEFSARLPSVVFGILGILGVYYLGRLMFSKLCGFISGLITATCVEYVMVSRGCVTDMVLTTAVLFCLLFFLLGWKKERKIYYLFSALWAAVAVLTKGPIGLFIPGIVVISFVAATRDWRGLKKIPFLECSAVFLAVALPWYIIVTKIHGDVFLNEFFGFQNIVRFLKPEHRIGTSPFFYIPVILGGFFPWSFFLPLGLWAMLKERGDPSEERGYRIFVLAWFISVFLFFSVSRTKLVTYILPMFPAIALITGRFLERYMTGTGKGNISGRSMKISFSALTVFSLLGAIGLSLFVRHRYPQAFFGTAVTSGIFFAGMVAGLGLSLKEKKQMSIYSTAASVVMICIPLVLYVLPVIEEFESSKEVSLKLKELAGANEPIAGESDGRRGIAFYTDRTDIYDIHYYDDMKAFLSREERVWGIVKKKHYDQYKEEYGSAISDPVYQFGKKVIFTNKTSF